MGSRHTHAKWSSIAAFLLMSILALAACSRSDPSDDVKCARHDLQACDRENARLRAACDRARDAAPCVDVGDTIRAGLYSSERGDEAANPHYAQACEMGHPRACFEVGQWWSNAANRARDDAKSQTFFERACTLGHPQACEIRGKCFEGLSMLGPSSCPKDLRRARTFFLRACELKSGTTIACGNADRVGEMLERDGG